MKRRRRLDLHRLLISGGVTLALFLIVLGFASGNSGDEALDCDRAVERVVPGPGELVLRQTEVGVDLATGHRGVLIIDGQEVPTFDLLPADGPAATAPSGAALDARFDLAQNTVFFQPREGATIEDFAPGPHTITAVFWRIDQSREAAKTCTWSFRVS